RDVARPAAVRSDVADVHDVTTAAHRGGGGLAAEEDAAQVEVEQAVPAGGRDLAPRRALEEGRAVHQDVDPTQPPDSLAHDSRGGGGVGQTAAAGHAADAEPLDVAHGLARCA